MVEQVSIDTSEETSGPTLEEQAAAMDAEQGTPEEAPAEATTEDRPEWLPEKFTSAEEMAKAYSELERKMSSPEVAEEQEEEMRDNLDQAGVDYDAMSQEFFENGELSEASYETLDKAGVPRSIVDSYIESQVAIADAQRSALMSEVGGEEGYSQLTQWAADNLEEAEINYYNEVMDSNNPNAIKMAVRAVAARRDAAEGMEPQVNLSGSSRAAGGNSYESVTQLMQDMQSPSYDNDPAFRAKVEAKLANSNIL